MPRLEPSKRYFFLAVNKKLPDILIHFLCSSFSSAFLRKDTYGVTTISGTISKQSSYLKIHFVLSLTAPEFADCICRKTVSNFDPSWLRNTKKHSYHFAACSQRNKYIFNSSSQPSEVKNRHYHYDLFVWSPSKGQGRMNFMSLFLQSKTEKDPAL